MKSDIEIQKDVMDQLMWEPILNGTEIGVSVKRGVVTLSGRVDNYSKKMAAEHAVRKVAGVKAVAEEIMVGILPDFRRSDTEIAEAVLCSLKWNPFVPEEEIKVKVEDGYVSLEGEVTWDYQRNFAKKCIDHLPGIKMVYNFLTVKPVISPVNVKEKIAAAFERSATIDAEKINVEVSGGKVTLEGKVRSFAEQEDAVDAAWSAPGVTEVVNRLELEDIIFAW
ncbi:ornithine aminotransferase [Niastella yeongjuensis]|uniref:Ornithine aminotransferase n=1 Tax=Niastella yeongjuensis TaxID=354355 RepID=A0A1V9EUH7_9BACT|nr:BON domain-containing protein [Niastella yeongjuensis]OQP49808.1 ornithine aminotransferase [Niastella yeongjuensis]SEP40096.1 Osmotically-inducible protein OsmY, contains BON domain [Niastella yeongjuensis]